MALSKSQVMALSDANSEINRNGLEKCGSSWIAGRPGSKGHDTRTIKSLVDRGLIALYAKGTIAHITDLGTTALADVVDERA